MKKHLLLLLSVLTVLSLLLGACGGTPEPTEAPTTEEPTEETATEEPEVEEQEPGEAESEFGEAPMLAEMVAAGELEPVEERLPSQYQVIEVVDSIGQYGGTLNAVSRSADFGTIKMWLYDPPVRWKADLTGYEPGLLTEMPVYSNDDKTITYHFREGLRWSDGEPWTTADLQFWWEDLAQNEDYAKVSVPWYMRNSDGTPITVEFPDDYTMVLTYDEPNYIAPYIAAQGFWEWEPIMKPAHFLKQYHPDYEGKEGDEGYTELDLMDRFTETPGYPTLMAWYLKEYTPGESWLLERNPYYWKVDTEGNQLPYIDAIRVELVQDEEVRLLQITQGRYDITFRGTENPTQIPLLNENAAAGDFRIVPGWMNGAGAWPGLMINQDYHEDQDYDPAAETEEAVEIRELLRNHDFRVGLSHAMNRQRVLDVVWEGIGDIKNFTISPQSWHFASDEGQEVWDRWANAYVEYDPDLAQEHFDAAGFVDADGDGWRDLPSGKPFTFIIDLTDWGQESINTPFLEVYRQNLEDVGVKVLINNVIGQPDAGIRGDWGLYMARTAHASELDLWTYPDWIFPVRGGGEGTRAFPMAGTWYKTGGEQGWEPEPGSAAARLLDIYKRGLQEPDEDKRHELIWEAVDVYIEQGPFILGATGDQPQPVVAKNYMRNVQEYGVLGPWAPGSPGNTHPEQWWMDK
ncbi:MAG: ABC transporter substrate-binding protein [Anaerolineae bacterium]